MIATPTTSVYPTARSWAACTRTVIPLLFHVAVQTNARSGTSSWKKELDRNKKRTYIDEQDNHSAVPSVKLVGYVSVFAGGAVLCYILVSLGVVDAVDGMPGTQEEPAIALPTYLSFVSAMMTAVTVVLAAVAIGIGIVAAYTFREIKNEAQDIASKTAKERAAAALSDDVIKARIDEIAFRQRDPGNLDELEKEFDPDDPGER